MTDVMINVREIYPSLAGDVTFIRTLDDVIGEQKRLAKLQNHTYASDQDALRDCLASPCMTLTIEPIGKHTESREEE